MCDCHADAVLGGVVQASGAAVVVVSAAVWRAAELVTSATPQGRTAAALSGAAARAVCVAQLGARRAHPSRPG
eukprot:scaffold11611_cov50-Phaeocystis_antarctica.AAC.1